VLSQESSRWAKIQNPDIVRLGQTLFDQTRLCPIRGLREGFLIWGRAGEMPDIVWLEVSILEVLRKTWLGYFHFIHTPLLIVRYFYTQEI
jgi:hypothetical protein